MNFEEELRSKETASPIIKEIEITASKIEGETRIMEVCGTHTVSLRRSGIHSLLPPGIRLISGPGCPVCVTPSGYIDNALILAEDPGNIVATFGDMLKVPGRKGISLARYSGSGNVKILYSPSELVSLARENPDKQVIFLGIGFETTIPTIAAVFQKAAALKLGNLFLYSAFKTVPQALNILLNDPNRYFDGFLLPGHVSVIIGADAYSFLEEEGGVPAAIAGFEPVDMLRGILSILKMRSTGGLGVENCYPRAVRAGGNLKALNLMDQMLEPSDEVWRALGTLPESGLKLRKEYQRFDAGEVFGLPGITDQDQPGCLCGKVILGKVIPPECSLFGDTCTPDHPVGPCMVSSEGTCAAYLRYGET